MDQFRLRVAVPSDAEAMLAIYRPYVARTAVVFTEAAPSLTEYRSALEARLLRYPCLVAEQDGEVVGYAYASPFRPGAAYDWAVETTIYLRQDCRGQGIGKALYRQLEDLLRRQNILRLNACIAWTAQEDEHLTNASQRFHGQMGFSENARFDKCGWKFGKWYDILWMEKVLGSQDGPPKPFIPFSQLEKA